jgi:hypothetical protein
MEWMMYFVPVIAIVGVLAYSQIARKNAQGKAAAGFGGQMFHDSQSNYFSGLGPRERIIAVWNGQAHTQPGSAAGAVLNAVAEHTIGISKYTPTVMVALTTSGRLFVAEEYSEAGTRGYYKTVVTLPPGARAVSGPLAIPEYQGAPPKNPFNPMQVLEAVALYAPEGSMVYRAWLCSAALACPQLAQPISRVLPFDPAQGPQIWAFVNHGAPQL